LIFPAACRQRCLKIQRLHLYGLYGGFNLNDAHQFLKQMNDFQFKKAFGIFNLAVVFLMLTDTWLLPSTYVEEIVSRKTVEESSSRSGRYYSWYLISDKDNKFKIPSATYVKLNPGDIFTVERTGLFKKSIQLSYQYNDSIFSIDNGVLYGSVLGKLGVLLVLGISIWMLFFHTTIRQPNDVKLRIILLATFVTVPLMFIYFIAQP
jgi:hypothetical protein